MPSMLRACVAWPVIVGLGVVFFLIGALAWVFNTIGGGLIAVAEACADGMVALRDWKS